MSHTNRLIKRQRHLLLQTQQLLTRSFRSLPWFHSQSQSCPFFLLPLNPIRRRRQPFHSTSANKFRKIKNGKKRIRVRILSMIKSFRIWIQVLPAFPASFCCPNRPVHEAIIDTTDCNRIIVDSRNDNGRVLNILLFAWMYGRAKLVMIRDDAYLCQVQK